MYSTFNHLQHIVRHVIHRHRPLLQQQQIPTCLLCYVPDESALSFYLKMEAVGSSEMLVTIYENQQYLIVTAAFTHASLSAHSHVKCVLKWSKTHIMHYTYTAATTTTSHTQIKDANNCIKNFTHISFPFLTFKMGHNVYYFPTLLVLNNKTDHTASTQTFCQMYIYMVGSPHFINITSIIHLNIPSLEKHQILVPKIIPRYKRSVLNCSIQTPTLFSLR